MIFKVFCDGFLQGSYNNVADALHAYKVFSCEYRKDLTILSDDEDSSGYGKILELPIKPYKDLTAEDVVSAIGKA